MCRTHAALRITALLFGGSCLMWKACEMPLAYSVHEASIEYRKQFSTCAHKPCETNFHIFSLLFFNAVLFGLDHVTNIVIILTHCTIKLLYVARNIAKCFSNRFFYSSLRTKWNKLFYLCTRGLMFSCQIQMSSRSHK